MWVRFISFSYKSEGTVSVTYTSTTECRAVAAKTQWVIEVKHRLL